MSFEASSSLGFNFHLAKPKYFGSLNSILGKLGSAPFENVALSFAATNCTPILTYGLSACNIFKKKLQIYHLYINESVFAKTFSTFDNSTIDCCHYYMRYLIFPFLYDKLKIMFLSSLNNVQSSPAHMLFKWFGKQEFQKLLDCYGIHNTMNKTTVSNAIWNSFRVSLHL